VITALDTNIISALWGLETGWQQIASRMQAQASISALVLCPAVYAELHAQPSCDRARRDGFLEDGRIIIVPMTEAMWNLAGERYAVYAARRRISDKTWPRRILTDFLIGSHAVLHADALMTDDRRLYRASFPELKLV
jgi:predicted nucleic acid-binding protein